MKIGNLSQVKILFAPTRATRNFSIVSSWHQSNSSRKSSPFVEHFRPVWPEKPSLLETNSELRQLPERTVPDSVLTFKLRATFDQGTAIYYPHLKFNPADFKVVMAVCNKVWRKIFYN